MARSTVLDPDDEHGGRLLGPNDLAPCKTESARRRHITKGETCATCGVGYEDLPRRRWRP